jgi:hypothetical protein
VHDAGSLSADINKATDCYRFPAVIHTLTRLFWVFKSLGAFVSSGHGCICNALHPSHSVHAKCKASFFFWWQSSAPMKNGLLAPADMVPPVPGAPSTSSNHSDDSLETLSSGSSRGRSNWHKRYPGNSHLSKTRIVNGAHDGPGKMAFRRTYSSNSIKVRQVHYQASLQACFFLDKGVNYRSRSVHQAS